MKKQFVITILLLLAIAYTTVIYFKDLNPPGMRTEEIMQAIPRSAAVVFEFNNNNGFYDVYKNNSLFAALVGREKLEDLNILRSQVLQNPLLSRYFNDNNIFISLHPSAKNALDLLFTVSPAKGLNPSIFDQLSKQAASGLIITQLNIGKEQGYVIYISALKKRLYVLSKANNILMASFSIALISQSAVSKNNAPPHVLLSNQQDANSLASLYVDYQQVSVLINQVLKNKNVDFFGAYKGITGSAALNLNYHSDALMFNGTTYIQPGKRSYFNLFAGQQPVENHLKDFFPSTTAYSSNFSVSNVKLFASALLQYQNEEGLSNDARKLFGQVKNETGIGLNQSFYKLLGNEFSLVTTRYSEKFAIISVLDGSRLKTLLTTVSTMSSENTGQLNYDKLPLYLLGDPFGIFKRPYFMIIDNYLILANSVAELNSYNDTYINRKFLSKNDRYNRFDNLLAGRSNVALFIIFKNTLPMFQNNLNDDVFNNFNGGEINGGGFYGASWQLTASDKNFYTNFCLKFNADTTINVPK